MSKRGFSDSFLAQVPIAERKIRLMHPGRKCWPTMQEVPKRGPPALLIIHIRTLDTAKEKESVSRVWREVLLPSGTELNP